MKNNMIKKISFVIVFSIVAMTTACSENTQNNRDQVEHITPNPVDTNSGTVNKAVVSPAVEPSATKELLIYTLNENTKEVESRTALVNKDTELTPELVVSLVTDSLADIMIRVDGEEVTTQGDAVVVSFNPDSLPVIADNNATETAILDVIAKSLVDNFIDKYPKVIFRIAGKPYSTKNYNFGLNDVYLDGTNSNQ